MVGVLSGGSGHVRWGTSFLLLSTAGLSCSGETRVRPNPAQAEVLLTTSILQLYPRPTLTIQGAVRYYWPGELAEEVGLDATEGIVGCSDEVTREERRSGGCVVCFVVTLLVSYATCVQFLRDCFFTRLGSLCGMWGGGDLRNMYVLYWGFDPVLLLSDPRVWHRGGWLSSRA
jgi:hypothetical protein